MHLDMKRKLFIFTLVLFISSISFVGCDNDDGALHFLNKNYKSTVTYPNGKSFSMTTQFQNNDKYVITITVPYESVAGEEDQYIKRMAGEFEYVESGKNTVKIKLDNLATIDYGYTGGDSHIKNEFYLPRIFPTSFTLKNKKLTNSDRELTGIVITDR